MRQGAFGRRSLQAKEELNASATMLNVDEPGTYARREWRVLSADMLDELVPA
jgi:hypothetical protein